MVRRCSAIIEGKCRRWKPSSAVVQSGRRYCPVPGVTVTDVQVQVTGRIKGHHTRADGSLPFLGFKHALYAYLSKLTVAGRQVNVRKVSTI